MENKTYCVYRGNDMWDCGHVDNIQTEDYCDCECPNHDHPIGRLTEGNTCQICQTSVKTFHLLLKHLVSNHDIGWIQLDIVNMVAFKGKET